MHDACSIGQRELRRARVDEMFASESPEALAELARSIRALGRRADGDAAVELFFDDLLVRLAASKVLPVKLAAVDAMASRPDTRFSPVLLEMLRRHELRSAARAALIEMPKVLELLTQALANLIENALHHTPAHTSIAISVDRVDGIARIVVADSGPGIPMEEREKVLGRFYRLESSRTTRGSGLGLALVAAIASLHGARIELSDNQPGLAVALWFDGEPSSC